VEKVEFINNLFEKSYNHFTHSKKIKFMSQIVNTYQKTKENLSRLEKMALWITQKVGTMGFFLIIVTWTSTWLLWNIFAPVNLRFDPFPAFVFWLFLSNMIQIMLMPLLLIGQNLQGKHSEIRAESDYQINTRAEKEIKQIMQILEDQNQVMAQILTKIN
jgi:uncharacterized membrane protein